MCSNEPIAEIASPSGKSKAIVFHRNCGATTGANTQVAVLPSYSSLPNIPGNTLIVDGDMPLKVRWNSESSLSISGMGTARVSKRQESVADVTIAYDQ